MAYTLKSRIRYSEIGEDERLTLNGIINYFQDCTTFHSEDVGLGLRVMEKKDRGWVLSAWQIVVERYPEFGEKVEISTWPYAFKGFLGNRNFTLKTENGEMLAYANTLWSFMDLKKGRPVMLTEEYYDAYEMGQPLEMNYTDRKVPIPEKSVTGESFPVRNYHLDTNHHVNNGQYIQMALEFIPQDFCVYQMRAEYKRQAMLGDVITPRIYKEEGCYTVALCQEDGEPYAVVEFSRKGDMQ